MSGCYFPGTRVIAFDPRRFRDDQSTPLSVTMRRATVQRWYGYISEHFGRYANQVDLIFDGDTKESRGHFADGMQTVKGTREPSKLRERNGVGLGLWTERMKEKK